MQGRGGGGLGSSSPRERAVGGVDAGGGARVLRGSELKVLLRALNQSLGGGLRGPEADPGG